MEWVLLTAVLLMACLCGAILVGSFLGFRMLLRQLEEAHKKVMARDLTDLMNAEASRTYLDHQRNSQQVDWNAIRQSPEFQRQVASILAQHEGGEGMFPFPGNEQGG